MNDIGAVAAAIQEGFKLVANVMAGSDHRRMRKAIQAGESYILTNEDSEMDVVKKVKLLRKYRDKFFEKN